MRKALKWAGIGLGGLLAVVLVALAVVYVMSEQVVGKKHPIPPVTIFVPRDVASIEEGARVSLTRGCTEGCHGKAGEGAVMFDEPLIARLVAPSLTDAVKKYDDAQLVVAIRHGLRPDGTSLIVMPSEQFAELNDEDLGKLIAYLRSLPAQKGASGSLFLGPLGRIGLVSGEFRMTAEVVAAREPLPRVQGAQMEQGRYLAQTGCTHCHGDRLQGTSNPSFTSPSLAVIAAYSPEAFTRLLRTGVAAGNRKTGVMGEAARAGFSNFTDAEIAALYAYLQAHAQQPS